MRRMLYTMEVSFLVLSVLFVFPATAEDDVILAVLGSTVVLECKIPQTDTLIWDRPDGTVLAIKGAVHQTVNASRFILRNTTALQSLSIHELFLSDDGQYRCYDLANAGWKQNFTVNIFGRSCHSSRTCFVCRVRELLVDTCISYLAFACR